MQITTIGLDLAKHWFQVHGVDANGQVVVRRRLWRSGVIPYFGSLEPCLVGIKACATAHYWARELMALGHTVKLMPPAYVKAYVKRNKNDAADAEAICEAVARPSMRFVPVKDAEQQSVLMLHRLQDRACELRDPFVVRNCFCQDLDVSETLRRDDAEFGHVSAQGIDQHRALPDQQATRSIRPRVRRLAGDDAAAEFKRRQGTLGADQQARRQIHPQPAHRRRGCGAASCP